MVADDRAQLLLVGAVLVAVVIVGTVVLLNSLQYTNTAGSRGNAEALDRAAETEATVTADIDRLTRRVRDDDPSDFEAALEENVSAYNNYTQNMTATDGATYVAVRLNKSASKGFRIGQTGSGDQFRDPDTNDRNWDVVNNTTQVEAFWLNTTQINGGPNNGFNLTVVGDSGDVWWLLLHDSGPTPTLETSTGTTCPLPGESVDIDLVAGRIDSGGCTFSPFVDELDAPYNVSVENGNRAEGTFTIQGVGDVQTTGFDVEEETITVPAIDLEYRSTEVAYNRTIAVEEGSS